MLLYIIIIDYFMNNYFTNPLFSWPFFLFQVGFTARPSYDLSIFNAEPQLHVLSLRRTWEPPNSSRATMELSPVDAQVWPGL